MGIGRADMNSREMLDRKTGIAALTERVIMEPGTYPKAWKLAERDASEAAKRAAKR